jgi:hypothetical protein
VSVDEPNKIDVLGISNDRRHVILAIADHLDWSDEAEHLLMLQNKLNAYYEMIKSGALAREVPKTRDLPVTIRIYAMEPLSKEATKFLEIASAEFLKDGIPVEVLRD